MVLPRAILRIEPAPKLVLLAATALLYAPALTWLGRVLAGPYFRLNAVLLIAAALAVVARGHHAGRALWRRDADARLGPLALFLGAEVAFLITERWLDAHILSAACALCALHAWIGLYAPAEAWRRGWGGLALLLAALPFGELAEGYLGVPARRLTAQVVEQVLASAGVASVPAETVLVLESGLVYVDAPCAGIRSLSSGLLFFAGITWVERARIDARWVAQGAALAAALMAANVLRVLAIVVLGPVAGLARAAALLHEPLGVIGFVAACGGAYAAVRRTAARRDRAESSTPSAPPNAEPSAPAMPRRRLVVPALIALAVLGALLHTRRPAPPPPAPVALHLPGEPLPLTVAERGLFARVGDTRADKRRFEWHGTPGTLLAVHSRSWRAHHAPEACLATAGFRVESLATWTLSPTEQLRVGRVDRGARTALYWYQSRARSTAELLTRTLAAWRPDEAEWVMVSILVEDAWAPGDPRALQLYRTIHASVADALSGGPK